MRLPPLFFARFCLFAARRIDPLDDPARAGCARFVKLARKIRLSSRIQQKRFSRIGKRGKLFSGAFGFDQVPNRRRHAGRRGQFDSGSGSAESIPLRSLAAAAERFSTAKAGRSGATCTCPCGVSISSKATVETR
jgi:hypothetical protein